MNMTKEKEYNKSLTVSMLTRQEVIDPKQFKLLTYSRPKDVCDGIESGKLGNMAGGFHFNLFGMKWNSSEHLYLCGEWSEEGEHSIEVQEYIRRMPSGTYAKRCTKAKYKNDVRSDFPMFRYHWMLWCVWQKCMLNKDFQTRLRSIPDDRVIVEIEKNDPVWAACPDEQGVLRGGNAMGKILTICKQCLESGAQPDIDTQLLNDAGIYILGNRIEF